MEKGNLMNLYESILRDPQWPKCDDDVEKMLKQKNNELLLRLCQLIQHIRGEELVIGILEKKLISSKEISRKVINVEQRGNTIWTTVEIIFEDIYQCCRKENLKQIKKLVDEATDEFNDYKKELYNMLAEFLKLKEGVNEIDATQEILEFLQGVGELLPGVRDLQKAWVAYEKNDYLEAALQAGFAALTFVPLFRGLRLLYCVNSKVKSIVLNERSSSELFKILSGNKNRLLTGTIRSIQMEPRGGKNQDELYEQIALHCLQLMPEKDFFRMAPKDTIPLRDLPRLETVYGKGDWQKLGYALKNKEGALKAEVHFYFNQATKEFVDIKFKSVK